MILQFDIKKQNLMHCPTIYFIVCSANILFNKKAKFWQREEKLFYFFVSVKRTKQHRYRKFKNFHKFKNPIKI